MVRHLVSVICFALCVPQVIGQRLLTGRMAIAESALVSCRVLHMKTEEYARKKVCNGLAGETSLYSMPQLKSVFDISYRELDSLMRYTAAVEERLNACLRNGAFFCSRPFVYVHMPLCQVMLMRLPRTLATSSLR